MGKENPMKKFKHDTVLLTTVELVALVKANEGEYVEASLCLNGGAKSTHFLIYMQGIMYDEGCDGEERETTLEEFENHPFYSKRNARWMMYRSQAIAGG
jgi:hypothetical protein